MVAKKRGFNHSNEQNTLANECFPRTFVNLIVKID